MKDTAILLALGILAGYAVLFLLSRKEEAAEQKSSLKRLFEKASRWIFRKVRNAKGRHRSSGEEKIREDLLFLDPSAGSDVREENYYVDKIEKFLLVLCAGALLTVFACLSAGNKDSLLISGRYIRRQDYGGGETDLTVQDENFGSYDLHVGERKYTKEETDALEKKFTAELPKLILGGNPDLFHVSSALNLKKRYEGYPFSVSWESSDYELVDYDGTVMSSSLEEGESKKVRLDAEMKYRDWTYEVQTDVIVTAETRTREERMEREIKKAIAAEDERSQEEEMFSLPEEVAGERLSWSEPESSSGMEILVISIAAAVLIYFAADSRLHEKRQKIGRELAFSYPQIVSRFVLYLGAGMSVRNVFYRLGREYEKTGKKGGKKNYVYEEILLVCHELDSGISEPAAYTHFGQRCRGQYTKLCSLLTQNLRKGNSTLLKALMEEADAAFEQRKNTARTLGEEAGTRLLFPMMMMLAVTMVMIMVPAMLGFSV